MGQLLWSWVLWGLWVLPGNAGAVGMGPPVPEQDPAEPVSSSRVPDSISAERHLDMSPAVPELGMCQLSPGQVEQPSALGDGTGSAVPQVVLAALDPVSPSKEQELPSSAAIPGGLTALNSPQEGLTYPKQTDWPTSVPTAPGTAQISSLVLTGHIMAVTHGNRNTELATDKLSPPPRILMEKGTGTPVPQGSSTVLTMSVGAHSDVQSTARQPIQGTAVPLQEGTVTEEHMDVTSTLTGDVPSPSRGMSPPVTHIPAAPLLLGTETPSSAISTATDADGLVQPYRAAVTADGTPRAARTTVLSDEQRSTGTSTHSLSRIPAEPHTATVLLSQELDDSASPLVTAASITAGDTDPASTTTGHVTSPTMSADAGAAHHDGIQKSGTMTPPGTASAVISPSPANNGVSKATELSTAGDGLHRDTTVTHPHVTYQLRATTTPAPEMTAGAMDVTTAPHVSTALFPALDRAEHSVLIYEASTGTAVLQMEGTSIGLDMGMVPSTDPAVSHHDGTIGGEYSTRTQAVTGARAAHPDGSTSGWAGGTGIPGFGTDTYGPETTTLSTSLRVFMEKGMGTLVPSSSSTAHMKSIGAHSPLQNTAGMPMPGRANPMQKGLVTEEHVGATSTLTGDVPSPSGGLSQPVTHIPTAPLLLGTETPSSAITHPSISTATDVNGLVQPYRAAVTADGTPRAARTTVLSDEQRSTGTSPHSLSRIPAEPHTATVLLSQELDNSASPLVTAASITAGDTDPALTTTGHVTSPTVSADAGAAHHDGIQKSGTVTPPGPASAVISPSPGTEIVSEAAAPGPTVPGTAGDGLHRDTSVTHSRVTYQLLASIAVAPDTSDTAMDVTTEQHFPSVPFPSLGSAEPVSVSAEVTSSNAVLQAGGTPMVQGMGTVPSAVPVVSLHSGGPEGRYSTRTMNQAVPAAPAPHHNGSSSGWAEGTVIPGFGTDTYGPDTTTLSMSPHVSMEKGMSNPVPSSSSIAPTISVAEHRALQNTAGQPIQGTAVPMQEGLVTEEHVSATSTLTGDVPSPRGGLSQPVTHIPAAPLLLGTETPSSAITHPSISTATDADGLVQPYRAAVTADGTPRAARTTVLSDDQHSTGTSSHTLSWIPAEPHTATVLLSRELTPGLDNSASPLVTAASITAGDTDPESTTTGHVTSPTVSADAGAAHHDGIQKSGTMTPPGTASAVISPSPGTEIVNEATALSTAGDGLHMDTTISHPRVSYPLHATTTAALGTTAVAMDVSAAQDVPTTPFPVLNSAKSVSVSAEVTSSNAVLQTEGVLMGLDMGMVSSMVPAVATDGNTAEQVRGSAVLGMVSSTQASPGTIAAENPTVGVPTATANSESTSAVSAPQTSPPSSASTTVQLVTATPGHSHSDAWVTVDMDTSSATMPMIGGAESGASRATPVSPSAVSSQRPSTALVPVTALPPDLSHSTAEQDESTSPSVLENNSLAAVATFVTSTVVASITPSASATGPAVGTSDATLRMVTASSSSVPSSTVALLSPHVTPRPPTKATSTPHDPTSRASSAHAWEATAMSWKDTIPSSNAITVAGSARGGSSMVTRHTTVSPSTAKATSTSSAQSPSATQSVLTALRVTNHKATSAFAAISSLTKGTPAATSPTRVAPSFGAQKGPITVPGTPAYATSQNPVSKPSTELVLAVSLYPFGAAEGDTECVHRTVDFNSPLLRPEIGFPLGKALRDTLYFTDNGQIIFPPTDSHVPSSPHPPSRGFSGHEALPMVAAFWDDADFSHGVGTTWYQEYLTLGSTRDPIIRDVEAKIQKYLQVPYSAKWTLKVTWEKAPAYPSQLGDEQTNTYQAVLSTDGSRSFALLLYQDGGMCWDYARLAARDALIGFSSGDGYVQNSELTQEPPAVRYRPDQHHSFGTDVRGLWLFRLDSCSQMNYRLQCLMWLQEQPPPSTWSMELPPCPCSLPQAELDPRYRRSRSAESHPIPGVAAIPQNTSDLFETVLRTTSPSQMGAGVRCVYHGTGLLEGWQERFWSPPTNPSDNGELEAFEWCCQHVGKPHFCTRYSEKRPRIGCEGYVPPTPANAFGDPHVTTLDGLTYTFNGLGDFMLLLASSAHTSFVLQGRMARTGTAQATNFMAFVAQYTSTTTTTVEWTLGNHSEVQVLLNYKTAQFSYSQDMGAEVYYSPAVLLVNTSSITAVFDGTVSISVSARSGMLSAVCSLPEQYRNGTKGLLGVWNHNPADDFQMPNGTNIPANSSEEDIFIYGMTWAVGEHSLFSQPLAAPIRTFNPIFLSELRQENESQYHLAASQCQGCRECIYDMLSTGDVALGLATQSLVEDFKKRKALLNAFPPVITGNPLLTAFRTEQVTRQYRAAGPGVRFVPHISPELNISEDGMLTWEPRGTAPLSVTLQAVSPPLPPALLQLSFTLCSCRSIQQCDYSSTTTVAGSSLQLAACSCDDGYWGPFCQHAPDPCAQGCFPGVGCDPHSGCGPCPPGLTGDGLHCADIDECTQKTACQGNLTCTNTVGSYACSCPSNTAGWDLGCGTACRTHSCPEGFCSNGGRCHLHPPSCAPTCECPPAFTDQRCMVAGGDFQPLASTDLPRRSVQLWVRAMQSATAKEVNATVSAILGSLEVKAFWSNINITCMTADGLTFAVVAEFAYNSSSFVIRFLNEELIAAITTAFNGQRARREADARLLFSHLHPDNITDIVKLSVPELQHYFFCTLYGYDGYQLDYVGTVGFICISPCKKGYCQHGGHCQHLPEGPTCSCVPFSIFSPGGARCEQLAVSLAAFIGIVVGALALLCLLLSAACLAAQLCRRHREPWRTKGTFWRQQPFSSLMKAEERAEASGRLWEPQLRAIDPSVQMRIKRPHILPPSQGAVQP